jgi:hypothetical protein
MTNFECAVAVLAKHREARMWDDNVVAADMLAQLGLDPAHEAPNSEAVELPPSTGPVEPVPEDSQPATTTEGV